MDGLLKRTGGHLAEGVIVALIIAAVNFLGYKFFWRADVTVSKQYTISQATKRVLSGLADPVSAELFVSADLPSQLLLIRDEVKDKLAEYSVYGHGKFKLRITDPGDDPKKKERAGNLGVREFQVQVVERDQAQVKKVFFGLVMNYEDKSEAIGVIADPTGLEYELTSRLLKLTMKQKPRVGLFTGPIVFDRSSQPGYRGIHEILGGANGMYEVVDIDPKSDRELPGDLAAVIICGAFGMSDGMKYSLDQYIMQGGQALIALDPMMRAQQQMGGGLGEAYVSLPTIEDQLQAYGVRFNKQLIVDPACSQANFSSGYFTLVQPYVLWPLIGPDSMSQDVSAVAKLQKLTVPWCCPLEEIQVQGVQYDSLASSSAKSFTITSPFNLLPDQDWKFLSTSSKQKGPFPVMCLLTGKFPTAFSGGPPADQPPPPTPEGEKPAAVPPPLFDPLRQLKVADAKARIVVLSSAATLTDDFLSQFQENIVMLANVVDMLAMGDELLGIRSAPIPTRVLKDLSDAQKSFWRWLNVLSVPVLLTLFGLTLWFIKGRRRLMLQQRYLGRG